MNEKSLVYDIPNKSRKVFSFIINSAADEKHFSTISTKNEKKSSLISSDQPTKMFIFFSESQSIKLFV